MRFIVNTGAHVEVTLVEKQLIRLTVKGSTVLLTPQHAEVLADALMGLVDTITDAEEDLSLDEFVAKYSDKYTARFLELVNPNAEENTIAYATLTREIARDYGISEGTAPYAELTEIVKEKFA